VAQAAYMKTLSRLTDNSVQKTNREALMTTGLIFNNNINYYTNIVVNKFNICRSEFFLRKRKVGLH